MLHISSYLVRSHSSAMYMYVYIGSISSPKTGFMFFLPLDTYSMEKTLLRVILRYTE